MAVALRMSRQGKKKSPFYRIVAADKRCARDGRFIELQGTAEGPPFERQALDDLMALGDKGIRELVVLQHAIVGALLPQAGARTE